MHEHSTSSLTGLMLPLADRYLLLPNVAVAELIDFQRGEPASDAPPWYLRQVVWRDRQLPLISFEAACGFIALVIQGIPRSYKLDSQLSFVDVPLCRLEKAAVQVADLVAKIPDLPALEQLVLESGLA